MVIPLLVNQDLTAILFPHSIVNEELLEVALYGNDTRSSDSTACLCV